MYNQKMKVENDVGLGDTGFVVTIPSFSDFPVHRAKSDDSIRSVDQVEDGKKKKKKKKEGTMASITQGINMMPDSEYIHKYLFQGKWYKTFRSIFLVSDRPRIHRLGYRSPVSVFVERSRHLASFPNVIHPYSAFRWYWDILMTIFLILTLILDPIRLTFYADSLLDGTSGHIETGVVITIIFLADIVLNFRTGVVDSKSDLVTLDPLLIGLNYVKTWFIVDVLSTIPFDLIYILAEKGRTGPLTERDVIFSKAVRIMDIFKILRLTRVIRYISRLLFAYKVSRIYIHFVELVIGSAFMIHWLACAHYLFPDLFNEGLAVKKPGSWITRRGLWNVSVGEKYLNCYYRSLSISAALGTGSESPSEIEEICCSIFNIFLGVVCLACYISLISSMLESQGVAERKYMDIVNQVKEYLRFKQVPQNLQDRILLFYETRYQRNFFREQDILSSISDVLRKDLLLHNCRHLVENVPIFRDLPQAIIYALISKLQFEVYLPLDVIVTVNTDGDTMYFIEHGMVSIVAENGRVLGHLKDGDFFGELALITRERRVASVVATSSCNTYKLTQSDFNVAMLGYPELLNRIMTIARTRKKNLGPMDLIHAKDGQLLQISDESGSFSTSSESASSPERPPPPPPPKKKK